MARPSPARRVAAVGLLGALACGGPVDTALPEVPPTEAAAAQPHVLVRRAAGTGCELALIGPTSTVRLVEAGCHVDTVFVAADRRALVFDRTRLDLEDLRADALPAWPPAEPVVHQQLYLDADRRAVLEIGVGVGEPGWMEGPSYPEVRVTRYVVEAGAWTPSTAAGPPVGTELGPGSTIEGLPADADRAALDAAAGITGEGWYRAADAPSVAWNEVAAGEGTMFDGPLLFQAPDGRWRTLPGVSEEVEGLDLRGEWLLVDGRGWSLVDLRRQVVDDGSTYGAAWFWPDG